MTVILVLCCYASLALAGADFQLTILHTNDVHARFQEANTYGGPCHTKDGEAGKCYGGVARRMSKVKELRQKHKNVLLLDAGDQFQGTLWFYVHKGDAASHFMNAIGYDAMALGNHEFDNEIDGLVPFLDNITFPALSSNIDAHLEPKLQEKFRKSVILYRGGQKIGIVGYTTKETPSLTYTGDLIFRDEIESIREEVRQLEAAGVNKIIAVGHAGHACDKDIAKSVSGVDVVIGGHSNTFLYTGKPPSDDVPVDHYPTIIRQGPDSRVLVVQDYAFGKYLGFLQVTFDDEGHVTDWNGNPILLDQTIPKDPAVSADVQKWSLAIEELKGQTIGKTHVFLDGRRSSCRLQECNLGNLLTDAAVHQLLSHPDELRWSNITAAVMIGGGIRTSINQGYITAGDVLNVLPFRNTLDIVEIQGTYIQKMMEHSVIRYNRKEAHGGFLQVSGLMVSYDLSKPPGHRVVTLEVRCSDCTVPEFRPINPLSIYKIIMPAFMVKGGDGYTMIKENMIKHHVLGDLDTDITIEYIQKISPIIIGLERRIQFIDSSKLSCQSSKAFGGNNFLSRFCLSIMVLTTQYLSSHTFL